MTNPDVIAEIEKRLVDLFQQTYRTAMADVPICNPALSVEAVGFREWDGQVMGILITPWFMNLVAAALPDNSLPDVGRGDRRSIALPAGRVELLVGEVPGFGRLDACSLFSPMNDFADHEATVATAVEALNALMTLAPEAQPVMDRPMSRRALFGGRKADPDNEAVRP